jgi:hypothetical protein
MKLKVEHFHFYDLVTVCFDYASEILSGFESIKLKQKSRRPGVWGPPREIGEKRAFFTLGLGPIFEYAVGKSLLDHISLKYQHFMFNEVFISN